MASAAVATIDLQEPEDESEDPDETQLEEAPAPRKRGRPSDFAQHEWSSRARTVRPLPLVPGAQKSASVSPLRLCD